VRVLKVFKYSDVPVKNIEGGAFCERAEVQRFITPNDSKDFRVFVVHFPAGPGRDGISTTVIKYYIFWMVRNCCE